MSTADYGAAGRSTASVPGACAWIRAAPLFVFDQAFRWLALETTVTILEGPGAATQNLRLFRVMQGRPDGPLSWFGGKLDEGAFLQAMADEHRLIYEFDVQHSYGLG